MSPHSSLPGLTLFTGIQAAEAGIYVAEALGITYMSCQATKLPRILGTLLLVPAAAVALNNALGDQDSQAAAAAAANGGVGNKARGARRRILIAIICCSVAAVLGTVASLACLSMAPLA